MALLAFFEWINDRILAVPTTILFFGAALFFTYKTNFIQFRMLRRCLCLVIGKIRHTANKKKGLNPFHAVFTAMATTMGMGSVVGPSIAIFVGGPGALFWLLVYIVFGSVTKFVEVVFAIRTRKIAADGSISGGPLHYLEMVHPFLAVWYGAIMLLMFASWSSIQANTLAALLEQEGVPVLFTGIGIVIFLAIVLQGGAQQIGRLASKIVPLMFFMYVSVGLYILCSNPLSLFAALALIKNSVLSPCAVVGSFCGATVFHAMHAGLYQGIFITEAGIGTSAIPHSLANTDNPIDQGLLAMYSTISDLLLATLSGLLVLVTGVWNTGVFRSTLIYEAFEIHAPYIGKYTLLGSLALFIITTIMGNSFNGVQTFSVLFPKQTTVVYTCFLLTVIFFGSFVATPLVWAIMKTVLACAAVPNIVGLIMLVMRRPYDIRAHSQ
jgi:AGCS family alanine or glycine:cation symporter